VKEVIEIGDVVTQCSRRIQHFMREAVHVVSECRQLSHDGVHAIHGVDGVLHRLCLLKHVRHAFLHVLAVLDIRRVLHADLERYRRVLDRRSQRSGYRLDTGDPWDVKDKPGNSVQYQHIRRITHIVIGFDQQQFRIHPSVGKVPLRGPVPALW
jgi:hypothetical protein